MRIFRRKKKINVDNYTQRWKALQKNCATRKTWPKAVIEADDLLCDALKCRGFKGKTTGEKLVAAQRDLSANDAVWAGHKLRKHLEQGDMDVRKLKKTDVVNALAGFRQALRDLGALEK